MLTGLPATAADAPAAWKAGVATAVITPQQAMWMAGYANRTNVSQGKFDDLHAKVLALEDERGGRMVFVTLDLIGIPRTMRKSLEARVEKAWQLPAGGLLLLPGAIFCTAYWPCASATRKNRVPAVA